MPRVRASVAVLRTDNRENRQNPNGCKFLKTMRMKCRWCHEMKCKTRTKCKTTDKNPTTEEIKYRISGKGKSWSYEYGKLYPGRYNTPPLREDLVPRSRMAPERNGRGREEVKLSCFFDEWVKPWTLRGWAKWRKKTTKMNKVKNTPLEKRNKGYDENQEV